MKKNIFYLIMLIGLFILLPNNVNGLSAEISKVTCDKLNAGGEATCAIYANIIGSGIQNVSSSQLEVTSGDDFLTVENGFKSSGTRFEVGDNVKIGTFKIKSTGKFGTAKISIQLEAEKDNDPTIKVPFVKFIKNISVLSSTATLADIRINDKTINGFSNDIYTYTTSEIKTNTAKIEATPSISSTKVTGVGTKKLVCGKNTFSIKTLAQDAKTSLIYKVIINKACDDNSTLKNITLSTGTLSPVFNPSTLEYKVTVDTAIDKITINAEKNNETQKVIGTVIDKELKYGDNTFNIKVTSEKGTTKTYKIVVNRSDGRSNNALLTSLVLDNGKITFDKNIFQYDTKVIYNVEKLNITTTPEDTKAKITITNPDVLKVGKNKIIVKVTAENGDTQEYTINVTRLKEGEVIGDNPKIETLTVVGYNIPFNPETKSYNLKVKNDVITLGINATMQEAGANYVIIGNEDLKDGSVITINTTSLDGTVDTYKIIIEKSNLQMYILIGAIVVLIGAISAIIYIMSKKRKESKIVDSIENVKQEESVSPQTNPFDQYREVKEEPVMSFDELKKYDPTPFIDEAKIVQEPQKYEGGLNDLTKKVEITEDQTKQCPECGHRINFSSKICPYCNKQF